MKFLTRTPVLRCNMSNLTYAAHFLDTYSDITYLVN